LTLWALDSNKTGTTEAQIDREANQQRQAIFNHAEEVTGNVAS